MISFTSTLHMDHTCEASFINMTLSGVWVSSKLTWTCIRWNSFLTFSPHYNKIRRYVFNILWQTGFVYPWSLCEIFELTKINASLSNCQNACMFETRKPRIILKMLQLFYINLAYIVYTYIKSSCWSIKSIYLLYYVYLSIMICIWTLFIYI